eukprot:m.224197 g.224197  ORF g.224197 m.224197 type:complete len:791 (+) comp17030_c7_seq6:65-2437(+)
MIDWGVFLLFTFSFLPLLFCCFVRILCHSFSLCLYFPCSSSLSFSFSLSFLYSFISSSPSSPLLPLPLLLPSILFSLSFSSHSSFSLLIITEMAKAIVCACAFLLLLAGVAVKATVTPKMLGGSPAEFQRHAIPDAANSALFQSSAIMMVNFQEQDDSLWSYSTPVVVDSDSLFQISIMSPLLADMEVALVDPEGNQVDIEAHKNETFWPVGDSDSELRAYIYSFEQPATGTYQLTVVLNDMTKDEFARRTRKSRVGSSNHGIIVVWNESDDEIFSQLNSYMDMRKDDTMGFQARMYAVSSNPVLTKNKGFVPTAVRDVVSAAKLQVYFPNGTILQEDMHDDGLHNDEFAADGVYGGNFLADAAGSYLVQTVLSGQRSDGRPFYRTATHSVRVVPRSLELTGDVSMSVDLTTQRLTFDLGVRELEVLESERDLAGRYRAYFELYGKSLVTGQEVPIAWSSAIVTPVSNSNGDSFVSLEVDMGWLVEALALGPFTLKNVYVQEVNTFIPVTTMSAINTPLTAVRDADLWQAFVTANATHDGTITEKMRFGVRPQWLNDLKANNVSSETGKLVLVHGYCSGGNPWKRTSEVWTEAVYFEDPKQSRSHDTFAQLIVEFAQEQGLTSYGLLGHSQGGFASVHVYQYYWSGVDNSEGERKLQSVGTPYQGNSGAGFWADILNSLVEDGCDSQEDLTRDGAQLWLTGVSEHVASNMYYYTSQYDKGGLLGKGYCNLLTNAVLKSPNDGVTENDYAHLDGANFMGNTLGQCHIDGMNWPAVYDDVDRNRIMNELAAR